MTDFTKQVDELFSEWDKTNSPGCVIAIIYNGKIVYKHGYGMANLELNVPLTSLSVFYLASVSKQFTAMAIGLLVEDEKIALTDDIRKYLPELPDYGDPITIEHLIYHTGGIRDYLELGNLVGKRMEDVWREDETMKVIARQKELNFPPGDQFFYSNSGYVLLAVIVKRITGKSLGEFADENIFQPLDMENTVFKGDHKLIIKNRVSGYSRRPDGDFTNEYHNLQTVGDGGLYTNVDDLFLWDQNFYNNKLGKGTQGLIDLLYTTTPLNDGTDQKYAFGLMHHTYRGLKVLQHGGDLNGARTQMTRFPDQKFTVICLSNLGDFNPGKMVFEIVDIYLADYLEPKEDDPSPEAIKLTGQELASKVGLYHSTKTGMTRRVEIEDGKLIIPLMKELTLTMLPLDKNRFNVVGFPVEIVFKSIKGGERLQMSEVFGNEPTITYESTVVADPIPDELTAYIGRYHSDELDTDYILEIEDDQLVLKHSRIDDNILRPTVKDGFSGNGIDIIFMRDDQNIISNFRLYSFGARNIHFVRM